MNDNKSQIYSKIYLEIKDFVSYYDKTMTLSMIAKMTVLTAALRKFSSWNFIGFYLWRADNLIEIGPYQSDIIPCARIEKGKGVCGTAWEQNKIIIISDVSKCENYISCDDVTKSEIVLPFYDKEGIFLGILDIDSNKIGNFDSIDEMNLSLLLNAIK